MFGPGFEQVLADARRGDAGAWKALYQELAPVITGYLAGQRAPSPEDVTSETLYQVVRDLHRFDGTETQFRSWVFAIAHNRLIDRRRYEAARPVDPTESDTLDRHSPSVSFEDRAVDRLGRAEIDLLLECTTPDQRDVLLLRYVADLTLHEVAEALDKEYNAVKALHRRALNALRERAAASEYPPRRGRTLTQSG